MQELLLMDAPEEFALAGSLEELKAKQRLIVHGAHRPILVVYDQGRVFALDNRCPHMGFPLERGTVEDGILTCHWHHARFDLESGCTFDLWADYVPSCAMATSGRRPRSLILIRRGIGISGSQMASHMISDSSSPRLYMVNSPPPYRRPISCNRWRCSGRTTVTAGTSV